METTKPMSIAIHDAKEDIIQTINRHNLPASVLLLLMKDIMSEVEALDSRVFNEDIQRYNELQKASETEQPKKIVQDVQAVDEVEEIPEEEVTVEE